MKKLLSVFITAAFMLLLTSCDSPKATQEPYNFILILGSHANAKELDYSAVASEFEYAASHAANVTIIVDDGSPFVYATFEIPTISEGLSAANKSRKLSEYVAELEERCSNASANSSEVDVFSSIALAARCVKSSSDKVIMIDSGLSTFGLIDLSTAPISRIDADSLISNILESEYQLDFKGASVIVCGLGEVAGEQPELSVSDYNNLVKFYELLFKSFNADTIIDTTPNATVSPITTDYSVTVCPVSTDVFDLPLSSNVKQAEPLKEKEVVEITETSIQFKPDSAVLVDAEAARNSLAGIAEKLKATDDQISVVGMTATFGGINEARELSLERAKTAAKLLSELGVDTSDYMIVGTGYDNNSYRVKDTDNYGNLIETKAEKNRIVLIMTVETAKKRGLI